MQYNAKISQYSCTYTTVSYLTCYDIHVNTHLPAGLLIYRCCSSDWSVNWSMRSTSHWSCDTSLMAAYSWMKVCGFSEVWSSDNSSLHCCCGSSLILCRALISSAPMTYFWNKKLMMLAGLTLLTTVWCSLLNLSFNASFDSMQSNSDY